jgi:hypothetical protein
MADKSSVASLKEQVTRCGYFAPGGVTKKEFFCSRGGNTLYVDKQIHESPNVSGRGQSGGSEGEKTNKAIGAVFSLYGSAGESINASGRPILGVTGSDVGIS